MDAYVIPGFSYFGLTYELYGFAEAPIFGIPGNFTFIVGRAIYSQL